MFEGINKDYTHLLKRMGTIKKKNTNMLAKSHQISKSMDVLAEVYN